MKSDERRPSGFMQTILAAAKHSKGYASFWDWPDKQVKERGIVRDLLKSIVAERGRHEVSQLWSNPNPNLTPDVIAAGLGGESIAFEVTELVDQETIQRKKRGIGRWKRWNQEEFRLKLRSIIAEKDGKTFHGGPFAKIALIIYTDEPLIKHGFCINAIAGEKFGHCRKITEVYLLLSHVPGRKYYPFIQLTTSPVEVVQ